MKVLISTRIPEYIEKYIKEEAKKRRRSVSWIAAEMLEKYMFYNVADDAGLIPNKKG